MGPGSNGRTQNGGFPLNSVGVGCPGRPSVLFPFPNYRCATVTNPPSTGGNVSVCLPPAMNTSTTGPSVFGNLYWNADNFTADPNQPANGCLADSDCTTVGDKCLGQVQQFSVPAPTSTASPAPSATPTPIVEARSIPPCTASQKSPTNGCTCYTPKNCTVASDCTGGTQCENKEGDCPNSGQDACICETSGIFSSACGPPNINWQNAIATVPIATPTPSANATYLNVFKKACPNAHSYQYDDASSDFGCTNGSTLNSYTVTFCGKLSSTSKR